MASKNYEIRKESNKKYFSENLDQLVIRVPKGQKEHYKELANKKNMSFNRYAIEAMTEYEKLRNRLIDAENLLNRYKDSRKEEYLDEAIALVSTKEKIDQYKKKI